MAEEGCCPCKKQSRCLRCSCTKNGRVCSDCIPSSMGTCCNRVKKPSGSRPPDTQCAKSPPGPSRRVDSLEVSSQTVLSCEEDDDFIPSLSSSFSANGDSPDASCETSLVDNPCGGSLEETVSPPLDAVSPSLFSQPPEAQAVPELPPYRPSAEPKFLWKNLAGHKCVQSIDICYDRAVHWIPNLFKVPHGKHGKAFVRELSRLFRAYAEDSPMECIALKAAFLLPLLVLQKPFQRSKNRDHVQALERRLDLWHDGRFQSLLDEGEAIQKRFRATSKSYSQRRGDLADSFSKLMFQGKVKAALRLLNNAGSKAGQPLSLDTPVSASDPSITVWDKLVEKHPEPAPVSPSHSLLVSTPPPDHEPHFIEFHSIDGVLVRSMLMKMDGAAGPSGMDVSHWKKACSSFSKDSEDLCDAIAMVARKLCSRYVDPAGVSALASSRLIALNKDPGVRPIGIGEVVRRVIGKAILSVIMNDILEVTGSSQLCAGINSACEAVVHAVRSVYESDDAEGVLLVDASNAFNSLNRGLALRNILHLCPSLGRVLINFYREESSLFIGSDVLLSKEGTTQGDPLAMVMYAVASIPLINDLSTISGVQQIWYADDATGMGSISKLRQWWDKINDLGQYYGYHPNAVKSTLLVKSHHFEEARELFNNTNVSVTCDGVNVLGCPLGSDEFVKRELDRKVKVWCERVRMLSGIAVSQPQTAYCALTHGMCSEWTYLFRTCLFSENQIRPLSDCINQEFIPSLLGRESVSDVERDWLSLPIRFGGLGLMHPLSFSSLQHSSSVTITKPLVDLILSEEVGLPVDVMCEMDRLKKKNVLLKQDGYRSLISSVRSLLSDGRLRLFEVSCEKGASTWLSALPLKEYSFDLHKEEFRDALCLRYGWRPSGLPLTCACGDPFSIDHSLICVHGGLINLRHNDVRDLSASLMKDVCPNVIKEPVLQPLTGETLRYRTASTDDEARLDISAEGFWGHRFRKVYFDVRVFCPLAPTNKSRTLEACYRDNELKKKRKYEQRVREVEHSSFTPLIFSTSGGCSPLTTSFLKRLSLLYSDKFNRPYHSTMNFIRCQYSFTILRSAIRCIRGTRHRGKILLGAHYPSDCIVGIFQGILSCVLGECLYSVYMSCSKNVIHANELIAWSWSNIDYTHFIIVTSVGFLLVLIGSSRSLSLWVKLPLISSLLFPSLVFARLMCVSPLASDSIAYYLSPPIVTIEHYIILIGLFGGVMVSYKYVQLKKTQIVAKASYYLIAHLSILTILMFHRLHPPAENVAIKNGIGDDT